MRKSVIIVSLFSDIFNPNSRIYKIATAFGSKAIVISPDFCHGKKMYKSKTDLKNDLITIHYIHVPSYKKNISLKRVFSHFVFAIKLFFYFRKTKEKPKLVVSLMPTSSAAYVCGQFCRKNKIKFVVDIIDLWPNSLLPLVKRNRIIKELLFPWQLLTNKAYKLADYISGESMAYAVEAHKINPNVPWSFTYLGVNKFRTNKLIEESKVLVEKDNNEITLSYSGSLGNSYDFENLLYAVKYIHENGINYKMYFIGEGERRDFIESYSRKHKLNVKITGRLNYPDYLKYLSISDIGFNPFKKGTSVVHSYKFNDYVACGLFIFNNLPGETAEMIKKYQVGINYNEDNLSENLLLVCKNWDTFTLQRKNLNLLIQNELDSEKIYKKLINDIRYYIGF